MNLNQLKYFISVAEEKSFTKASKRHFISQTAITLQVKELEDYLGCELINRDTRPISLTTAGKTFLKEAKNIVSRMDNALVLIKDTSESLEGSINIGYLKGYENSDFCSKLAQFHRKYPNISLNMFRMGSDELENKLKKGDLDVIVTIDSNDLKFDFEIGSKDIDKVSLVVALSPDNPLSNKKYLFRSNLIDENIICLTSSSDINNHNDKSFKLFKESGYDPNIVTSTNDYESALMMVSSELGICIMPEYCSKNVSSYENVVFVPLIGNDENEEITLMYKDDNPNIKLINALKDMF